MSHTIVQPEGWAKPKGYANGVVATGRMLFVAGQVGWNPKSEAPEFPATFEGQFDQALSNVMDVVRAAGGSAEHIARMTVYVTDKHEYLGALKAVGAAWKKHLGRHFPAMALVEVKGLVEPGAKLEIETTAMLP